MKKFLMIAAAVVIGTMGFSSIAQAQDSPIAVEIRGNMTKGFDAPIDYYPSYAFVFDFGAPIDLSFSWGTPVGSEDRIIELGLPLTFYTYQWGSELSPKGVDFQLYPITNLNEGTTGRDRSIALGVIYDAGVIDGVNSFARGVWHNYELEGMTEAVTDWGFQFGVVAELKMLNKVL